MRLVAYIPVMAVRTQARGRHPRRTRRTRRVACVGTSTGDPPPPRHRTLRDLLREGGRP
jgi:hypothetical protein